MSPFSVALAGAYRGFMNEARVTGKQIAKQLGRNAGYVSERINGKRPLDTEDVDTLALLAGGDWTGQNLMMELVRRANAAQHAGRPATPPKVHALPPSAGIQESEENPALSAIDARERFRRALEHGGYSGHAAARGGLVEKLDDEALNEIADLLEDVEKEHRNR